jgi:hypothetical protein
MTDAEFIRKIERLVRSERLVEAIDVLVKDRGYQMEAIAQRLEDDALNAMKQKEQEEAKFMAMTNHWKPLPKGPRCLNENATK